MHGLVPARSGIERSQFSRVSTITAPCMLRCRQDVGVTTGAVRLRRRLAVMFFQVISGFLITYTLTRNDNRDRSGVAAFYSNRFIRIFSLYWPMVILALLIVASAWPKFVAAGLPDKFTAIFLIDQDWRFHIRPCIGEERLADCIRLGRWAQS